MKTLSVFIVSSIVIFLSLSCGEQSVNIEQEKENLLQTDRDFATASVATNAAEAFKMYLAEDAIQMPVGSEPIIGRDKIYESMSKSSQNYVLNWNPQRAEVAEAGDMGWTWGWYMMTYTDENGEEKTSRGKYLNVWRKMPDGNWRVVVDMGN